MSESIQNESRSPDRPWRVLITGGAGLLGSELIRRVPAGIELHATQRNRPVAGAAAHVVELSDHAATAALLERVRPDLVIHTAYSQSAAERDVWWATQSLVHACAGVGCGLIHMSSDTVFDGEHAPYAETDRPSPVSAYGRFKLLAEAFVHAQLPSAAVVRTSLILRPDPPDPIFAWMLNAQRCGEPVRLFVDELRCPIVVEDLARQIWEIAALPTDSRGGIWHLAGPEALSRFALGMLVGRWHGLDLDAISPAFNRDAAEPRPRDLRLLTTRADRELRTRARTLAQAYFVDDAP